MSDQKALEPTGLGDIARVLRHWPVVLVGGIISVLAGVLALAWPGITVLVAGVLFSVSILLQGLFAQAAAWDAAPKTPGRGWLVFWGVLSTVAGAIGLFYPSVGVFALVYLLIFWFLLDGVNNFIRATSDEDGRWWFVLLGILDLVVAGWLVVDLEAGIATLALIVGIGLLIRGGWEISLAFRLRGYARKRASA